MDTLQAERRDTQRLAGVDVQSKTLNVTPPLDILWKEDVENLLSLSKDALNATPPTPPAPEHERSFVPAGDPVCAPLQDSKKIEPVVVDGKNGLVSMDEEELEASLSSRAQHILQADVETVVGFEPEDKPIWITYEFDEPVTAAKNVYGTIYTAVRDGEPTVEFQPGVPTKRVIQIVELSDFPSAATDEVVELNIEVSGGRAVWTKSESN